jgi:Flp pilus assembly protein TadD
VKPDSRTDHSLRAFVRNAWVLLVVQLCAAAAAVAVTAWAVLQVRPLFAERERLTKEISDAETRVAQLDAEERKARNRIAELQERAAALSSDLQGARKATPVLTQAINAFHQGRYAQAIVKYDEALALNPGDPYVHNLKSYSQFKMGDFASASQTLSRGLQIDPTYDWGYFDLARYQCAAGAPADALRTITTALEKRGAPIENGITFFLTKDGEFRRLCAPIRKELQQLANRR